MNWTLLEPLINTILVVGGGIWMARVSANNNNMRREIEDLKQQIKDLELRLNISLDENLRLLRQLTNKP